LRTARLELRPFALSDAPAIHAVYSDPEVMEHVGNGPVADLEETEAMLRVHIAHQEAHGFSFWAVIEPTAGSSSATPGSIS
jgi:[ribosomal protein S5]-alanine N-acetyltransferase